MEPEPTGEELEKCENDKKNLSETECDGGWQGKQVNDLIVLILLQNIINEKKGN